MFDSICLPIITNRLGKYSYYLEHLNVFCPQWAVAVLKIIKSELLIKACQ